MGGTTPLILRVSTPQYGWVTVEASDGYRYSADLAPLSAVYCFPKDQASWDQVSVDSHGLAIVWASRFEVHVDQVVALMRNREPIRHTA